MKTKTMMVAFLAAAAALQAAAAGESAADGNVAAFDSRMAIAEPVITDGMKWIDGRSLSIEGRMFDNVDKWYDRLPSNVTTNVNGGVRNMKHHTAGMQFRFSTDSTTLVFKWIPFFPRLGMDHMPATGASGIDVYRFDAEAGKWRFAATGRIKEPEGSSLKIGWTPGVPCLVNLPLYNGIKEFSLGIDTNATVSALGPRKSGIDKPVVFYGTSITHGACASRPGMAFVNIVGRDLDVPVVDLGFSGNGLMEFEMSEHLAAIDASCYVLDCLWNMHSLADGRKPHREGKYVEENYEPFVRNLRAKRPGVPIVFAGECDFMCRPPSSKERYAKSLYDKLVAEGWKNLYFLPKDGMLGDDFEGTTDGCHPNDLGMMRMAAAYGRAVREALFSRPDGPEG
jgi:lysophospholipase L1-like esterase